MQRYEYKPVRDMMIDDAIEGFYLLKSPQAKVTQNGKPFLSAKIADGTGEVESILWDYAGDIHTTCAGNAVKIRGTVSEYNGKKQLTIAQIRAPREGDQIDYTLLIPTAPIEPQQTLAQMVNLIDTIKDQDYKNMALTLLDRYKDLFCCVPAAKSVHHAFRYGLLMHTYFMMCHANFMANFYTFVNRDLLLCGTFCHDIAKIKEYEFSPMGLVNDFTVEGHLLGHLYMGAQEIAETAKTINMPAEKSMLLQHMLLSHHGKPEFGAAVVPKTAEAQLLSMIDDLDAKMELFREALDGAEPGMTDTVRPLGVKIYNHE